MRKRIFAIAMVLLMLCSLLPTAALAANVGDGTAQNPYQIGDTVIGDTEPTGEKAAGSRWTSQLVPAVYGTVASCTTAEHTHTTAACSSTTQVACQLGSHGYNNQYSYTHQNGRQCTRTGWGATWYYSETVLTCTTVEHTHSIDGGCYPVVTPAYTLWTLEEAVYSAQITVRRGNTNVNGQTVTITDGTNTYTAVTSSGVASIQIPAGTYTASVSYLDGNNTYEGSTTLTVTESGGSAAISVQNLGYTLANAQARYDRVTSFNHVDIRAAGQIQIGTYVNGVLQGELVTKSVTITNPRVTVTNNGSNIANESFTGSTSYEWRITRLTVPKTAVVTLICDMSIDGGETLTDQTFTFSGEAAFVQAIYNCDINQGLDFIVSAEDITQQYYNQVEYQWTGLPEGMATLPQDLNHYANNASVTVDTSFTSASKLTSADGLTEYTFSGWTSYIPEGGTETAITGATFAITADTVIKGVWTSKQIPQTGSLTVTKAFATDSVLGTTDFANGIGVTVTGPENYSNSLTLSAANSWTTTINDLAPGDYTVAETAASADVVGYTRTTTYSVTGGVATVAAGATADVTITNSYARNMAEDDVHNGVSFTIKKIDADTEEALSGASFALYDTNDVEVYTGTTSTDGTCTFGPFTAAAVYTLRETQAPTNYLASSSEWTVTVSLTEGDPQLVLNAQTNLFEKIYNWILGIDPDLSYDTVVGVLTVPNETTVGKLTVTKAFATDSVLGATDFANGIGVTVTGPNSYSNSLTLSAANSWTVTLENLPAGNYTVAETAASADVADYTRTTSYSVTGGVAAVAAGATSSVTITNSYAENGRVDVGASFTVKKVDAETGELLPGATFVLYDADNKAVETGVTGTDGTYTFVGPYTEAAVYTLKETQAPTNYVASSTVWTVTVSLKDGDPQLVMNTQTNVFDAVYNWIAGITPDSSYSDGILTVKNEKALGSLTLTNTVEFYEDGIRINASLGTGYEVDTYSYTVTIGDNSPVTFNLADGDSRTIENIPYGSTYSIVQNSPATAAWNLSWGMVQNTGTISAAATTVDAVNVYDYRRIGDVAELSFLKLDSVTEAPLAGAEFTLYADAALTQEIAKYTSNDSGKIFPLSDMTDYNATYYLKETKAPANYMLSDQVITIAYNTSWTVHATEGGKIIAEGLGREISLETIDDGYTYVVPNVAYEKTPVHVQKVWEGDNEATRPAAIEVTLYRNGQPYDTVELNADKDWSHTWDGADITAEYTWTVDEVNVPEGYVKTVTSEGNNFLITNCPSDSTVPVEITVRKYWYGDEGLERPESVKVTLYKDGKAYDTQTLSSANGWTYTWKGAEDMTSAFTWTVDETEVPEGYFRVINQNEHDFTITNCHNSLPPQTGDSANPILWALMSLFALTGAGFIALKLRKKTSR